MILVTYTAVRGVLEPPEPAPSMLKMCPPLFCLLITSIAPLVHRIDPIKFVETICINSDHQTEELHRKGLSFMFITCLISSSVKSSNGLNPLLVPALLICLKKRRVGEKENDPKGQNENDVCLPIC